MLVADGWSGSDVFTDSHGVRLEPIFNRTEQISSGGRPTYCICTSALLLGVAVTPARRTQPTNRSLRKFYADSRHYQQRSSAKTVILPDI